MTEAQFEYKCRRCRAKTRNPCCNVDTAREIMFDIAMHGVGGTLNKGGRIRMYDVHYCKDGGLGISDLQGCAVVETQ